MFWNGFVRHLNQAFSEFPADTKWKCGLPQAGKEWEELEDLGFLYKYRKVLSYCMLCTEEDPM